MGFGDSLRAAKTGKGGKVLLQRHLWCPDDLRGKRTEMRLLTLKNISLRFDTNT